MQQRVSRISSSCYVQLHNQVVGQVRSGDAANRYNVHRIIQQHITFFIAVSQRNIARSHVNRLKSKCVMIQCIDCEHRISDIKNNQFIYLMIHLFFFKQIVFDLI